MFESINELISTAESKGLPLHVVILENEMLVNECSKEEILKRLKKSFEVMRQSLKKGTTIAVELPIKEAMEQSEKLNSPPIFFSRDIKEAIYWAMSIAEFNSGMGLICAAPTAGSAGVLPAALFKAQQLLGKTDEEALNALLVGSEIGVIIGNNATLSGSEGGCQAEVGVASAMAAAAITNSNIRIENLATSNILPDRDILQILWKMGCKIKVGKDYIDISPGRLKGIIVDARNIPDIVPVCVAVSYTHLTLPTKA